MQRMVPNLLNLYNGKFEQFDVYIAIWAHRIYLYPGTNAHIFLHVVDTHPGGASIIITSFIIHLRNETQRLHHVRRVWTENCC